MAVPAELLNSQLLNEQLNSFFFSALLCWYTFGPDELRYSQLMPEKNFMKFYVVSQQTYLKSGLDGYRRNFYKYFPKIANDISLKHIDAINDLVSTGTIEKEALFSNGTVTKLYRTIMKHAVKTVLKMIPTLNLSQATGIYFDDFLDRLEVIAPALKQIINTIQSEESEQNMDKNPIIESLGLDEAAIVQQLDELKIKRIVNRFGRVRKVKSAGAKGKKVVGGKVVTQSSAEKRNRQMGLRQRKRTLASKSAGAKKRSASFAAMGRKKRAKMGVK